MSQLENFNSHARVGRDLLLCQVHHSEFYFNSHARVGRDLSAAAVVMEFVNFNSHARVGRDYQDFQIIYMYAISTHTPV